MMMKMMIGKYLPVLSDQMPDLVHHWAPYKGHPQPVEDAARVMKPTEQYL